MQMSSLFIHITNFVRTSAIPIQTYYYLKTPYYYFKLYNVRDINQLIYAKMLSIITIIACYGLVTFKYLVLMKETK